jgi:hypothetical protein
MYLTKPITLLLICLYSFTAKGQTLQKFQKETFSADGSVVVLEGMQNESGKVVIPAIFEFIWPFQNDTISFARRPNSDEILNGDGQFIAITISGFLYFNFPSYYSVESYQAGLFKVFDKRRNLYGFIKKDGNTAIKPQFTEADDFSEGLAAVELPTRRGTFYTYINLKGKQEFNYQFHRAYPFSQGKGLVEVTKNHYGLIDKMGKITPINGKYQHVYNPKEGFCITNAKVNNVLKFGFVKVNGEVVLEPTYDFIDNFEMGTATFFSNGKAGMIDTGGNIVIEARYDEIYRFDQFHYIYESDGLKGLMTTTGEQVFPPVYSEISYFVNGLCPVRKNTSWGLSNIEGKLVVPCKYSGFERTSTGWRMQTGDDWLLVKNKVDTLVLPKYDEVSDFFGQIAAVKKNELWGFVNLLGEEAIEPMFDEVVQLNGTLFMCRTPIKNNSLPTWSLVNSSGLVLQKEYFLDFAGFSNGLAAVKTINGWGYMNSNGFESIPPKFEEVRNFSDGYAAVYIQKEWGIINKKGEYVIPPCVNMVLDESNKKLTIAKTREKFPLYRMGVIGDVSKDVFVVVDLSEDESERTPLCMKINNEKVEERCLMVNKKADTYTAEKDKNSQLEWLLRSGRWILFNDSGKELN